MDKKWQRGEIATIITIGTLVILGLSTLVSSVFLNGQKKQVTSSKAAELVTCRDNPDLSRTPAGYYWKADCSKQCVTNADCPTSTSGYVNAANSNWCYGFDGPNKSAADWRCLMLQYGSAPNQPNPQSTPVPPNSGGNSGGGTTSNKPGDKCRYSQMSGSTVVCYEGNIKDDGNCGYVNGVSTGTEISCSGNYSPSSGGGGGQTQPGSSNDEGSACSEKGQVLDGCTREDCDTGIGHWIQIEKYCTSDGKILYRSGIDTGRSCNGGGPQACPVVQQPVPTSGTGNTGGGTETGGTTPTRMPTPTIVPIPNACNQGKYQCLDGSFYYMRGDGSNGQIYTDSACLLLKNQDRCLSSNTPSCITYETVDQCNKVCGVITPNDWKCNNNVCCPTQPDNTGEISPWDIIVKGKVNNEGNGSFNDLYVKIMFDFGAYSSVAGKQTNTSIDNNGNYAVRVSLPTNKYKKLSLWSKSCNVSIFSKINNQDAKYQSFDCFSNKDITAPNLTIDYSNEAPTPSPTQSPYNPNDPNLSSCINTYSGTPFTCVYGNHNSYWVDTQSGSLYTRFPCIEQNKIPNIDTYCGNGVATPTPQAQDTVQRLILVNNFQNKSFIVESIVGDSIGNPPFGLLPKLLNGQNRILNYDLSAACKLKNNQTLNVLSIIYTTPENGNSRKMISFNNVSCSEYKIITLE